MIPSDKSAAAAAAKKSTEFQDMALEKLRGLGIEITDEQGSQIEGWNQVNALEHLHLQSSAVVPQEHVGENLGFAKPSDVVEKGLQIKEYYQLCALKGGATVEQALLFTNMEQAIAYAMGTPLQELGIVDEEEQEPQAGAAPMEVVEPDPADSNQLTQALTIADIDPDLASSLAGLLSE